MKVLHMFNDNFETTFFDGSINFQKIKSDVYKSLDCSVMIFREQNQLFPPSLTLFTIKSKKKQL